MTPVSLENKELGEIDWLNIEELEGENIEYSVKILDYLGLPGNTRWLKLEELQWPDYITVIEVFTMLNCCKDYLQRYKKEIEETGRYLFYQN